MKNTKIDLCVPCANKMKNGYNVKYIKSSIDNKITCGLCSRRRFGATYELSRKEKDDG